MIRKTIFAIAATAALATIALPSVASAKHGHHGHRGGWGGLYIVTGGDYDCGWEYYRVGKRVYKQWTCSY